MGQTLELKMAKASKEDLQAVREFFELIEEVIEYGTFTKPDADDEEDSIEVSDEDFVIRLRQLWSDRRRGVDASWRRVVLGCEILIDNACDPDADTLEWRPDIKAALEAQGE